MARLPQLSASIQINPDQARVPAAPKGKGLQALGLAIQQAATDVARIHAVGQQQEQETNARLAASAKVLAVREQFAALQLNPGSPDEHMVRTREILSGLADLPPTVRGTRGTAAYTRIIGGLTPGLAKEAFDASVAYRTGTARSQVSTALEQMVRDIAATPEGRGERLDQAVDFIASTPQIYLPEDRATLTTTFLDRVGVGIAFEETNFIPSEALRKLRNSNGYSVRVGTRDVLVRLSPEQRQALTTRALSTQKRLQGQATARDKEDETQLGLERGLVMNTAAMQITEGDQTWRGAVEIAMGGVNASVTSSDLITLENFSATMQERQDAGGPGSNALMNELLIGVELDTVRTRDDIGNAVGVDGRQLNHEQVQAVQRAFNTRAGRQADQGLTAFNQKKRTGAAFITKELGAKLSVFQKLDPEGDELNRTLTLQYLANMNAKYEALKADHPGAGPAFAEKVAAIDPMAEAVNAITNNLNMPQILDRRLAIGLENAMSLLQPFHDDFTFREDVDGAVLSGAITETDAAFLYLLRNTLAADGLTLAGARQELASIPPRLDQEAGAKGAAVRQRDTAVVDAQTGVNAAIRRFLQESESWTKYLDKEAP